MTSKERIKKIFNFEIPDRVGTYDQFWSETRVNWCTRIGIEDKDFDGHFGIDIAVIRENQKAPLDRFCALSVTGPFGDVASAIGLQNMLGLIGRDTADVINELRRSAHKTIKDSEAVLKKKSGIDGIWLWDDMAGDKGLFFSPNFYKNCLLPLHKQICAVFAAKGLPVILHSDGNINSIIPHIIESGFKAIHPVESQAGMSVGALKKQHKGKLVFIGNVSLDLIRYARDREFLSKVIRREIETAKLGGGYIFGFENPISPEINLDMYSLVIDTVKKYGTY